MGDNNNIQSEKNFSVSVDVSFLFFKQKSYLQAIFIIPLNNQN